MQIVAYMINQYIHMKVMLVNKCLVDTSVKSGDLVGAVCWCQLVHLYYERKT